MFGRNTDTEEDVIFMEDDSGLYEMYGSIEDPDNNEIMFRVIDFENQVNHGYFEIYDITRVIIPDIDIIEQYGRDIIRNHSNTVPSIEEYMYQLFKTRWMDHEAEPIPMGELLYNIIQRN